MTREDRRVALEDFTSRRRGVLLATDAAGEGLNLQHACRVVINLELPWNPVRLEQRAGRVDRIGQHRTVHAFHLIAGETGEIRVLERLESRIALARQDIDAADPLSIEDSKGEAAWLRLVVDGGAPNIRAAETAERSRQGARSECRIYTQPQLSSSATVEHARLLSSRALRGHEKPGTCIHGGRPLLTFTRRAEMRARLGSQVLVLMQTVIEDSCGHVIATDLTPALVRATVGFWRSVGRKALARAWPILERALLESVQGANASWQHEQAEAHRRFWQTRMDREVAIATVPAQAAGDAFQPGLFDRRAVDGRLAWTGQQLEILGDLARRQDEIRRAAAGAVPLTRVRLILVP
jgi:superfamily II DNA/RNA helicase